MTITEVGCMGVKPGLDIMDESKPEGRVLPEAYDIVVTKPGGPSRAAWGLEDEDPSRVWAFFDWESVEQHKDFIKTLVPASQKCRVIADYSPSHAPDAVKHIPSICTPSDIHNHVRLSPSTDPLVAPWAELILAYFAADIAQDDKDVASQQMERVLAASDVANRAQGWSLENDFPVRDGDGKTGTALMGVIGWASREAQAEYRKTDAYKEATELLKSTPGLVGTLNVNKGGKHLDRKE